MDDLDHISVDILERWKSVTIARFAVDVQEGKLTPAEASHLIDTLQGMYRRELAMLFVDCSAVVIQSLAARGILTVHGDAF